MSCWARRVSAHQRPRNTPTPPPATKAMNRSGVMGERRCGVGGRRGVARRRAARGSARVSRPWPPRWRRPGLRAGPGVPRSGAVVLGAGDVQGQLAACDGLSEAFGDAGALPVVPVPRQPGGGVGAAVGVGVRVAQPAEFLDGGGMPQPARRQRRVGVSQVDAFHPFDEIVQVGGGLAGVVGEQPRPHPRRRAFLGGVGAGEGGDVGGELPHQGLHFGGPPLRAFHVTGQRHQVRVGISCGHRSPPGCRRRPAQRPARMVWWGPRWPPSRAPAGACAW